MSDIYLGIWKRTSDAPKRFFVASSWVSHIYCLSTFHRLVNPHTERTKRPRQLPYCLGQILAASILRGQCEVIAVDIASSGGFVAVDGNGGVTCASGKAYRTLSIASTGQTLVNLRSAEVLRTDIRLYP